MKINKIRFKQRDYKIEDPENYLGNWSIEKYGCGPTSIANILANFGYDVDPVYITRKIIFDKQMKFDSTYLKEKGINYKGLINVLDIWQLYMLDRQRLALIRFRIEDIIW